MKKTFLIFACLIIGLCSCSNFDIAHPDYKYTSGYFPYQFPVRTLILGDYIYDNSNDINHQFVISVHMGGVYENNRDRKFEIEIYNNLCDSLLFNNEGDTIRALPSKYYSLSSNTITIPKGKLYGGVVVQLTDAFFKDSNSIGLNYVVPLRIISSNDVDTILLGRSENPNADPRITSDWIAPPKNFTMFAVKYINEFEGTYFKYGESEVKGKSGDTVEDSIYSAEYVVNNSTSKLVTTARYQVSYNTTFRSDTMSGDINTILTFNGKSCTVTAANDSIYTISGTGEFKAKAFKWGGKERNGIVLKYSVSDGNYTYTANDTLVSRDRGVVMETYTPVKY